MIFRSSSALTIALMCSQTAFADCRYSVQRQEGMDASGIRTIVIQAGAGDLSVRGSTTNRVEAKGKACAGSQAALDAVRIEMRREGDTLRLETVLPDDDSWTDHESLDLTIELPTTLDARIEDSSGDLTVANLASVRIDDSSGDQTIRDINGDVVIRDSSGEIDLGNVRGNVELSDSSGDVAVADVSGSVRIAVDSSGGLSLRRVHGDVVVETDSSGDIVIAQVNKNVTIENDSSGDIRVDNVGGDLRVVHDSSGDIEQRNVLGRVSIPREDRD